MKIILILSGMLCITIGMLIHFQMVYKRERRISEEQKKELEEVNLSKSQFFANMSHEIRTPINTIIGLNEMTLREDVSDEVVENAVNIQNASKMLLSLINDILDLSKIESGKMEIVPSQYETGALFSDLVNMIWIRAHEKQLEFRMDIDQNLPSMLYGDEVRLRQVLLNILTNAVKYTKEGSVTLSAKCEKKAPNLVTLKVAVTDTGMGIRKESMGDLFSSFKRVDERKNKNIEGTGLGLSISKQLVNLMHGKIEVDRIYTKGSTFTVTIDQEVVDPTPMGTADFVTKKKIFNHQKYRQSFEAPEACVLIVDDNEMNLMVAKKLLRGTKVQIDVAASGKECLDKTKRKAYHMIFMDHKMSELDGVETLHLLRKQENGLCNDTPVIALTANVMSGAEEIYRGYGFEGYLAKPVNGTLLEAVLLKYLPRDVVEYSIDADSEEMAMIQMISNRKKKPIHIMADGVCDIPKEYIEQYDIGILYFYVTTDVGVFKDVKEITTDNLLSYLEDDRHLAVSAGPSEEEYEHFYADALEQAEQVLHITISKNVDKDSFAVAQSAMTGFDHVTIYDSGHLSSGMGLMVLTAAKMAQEQRTLEEILGVLNQLKNRVETSFIVPTLKTLGRSGLVTSGLEKVFEMLDIHPILYLSQGKIKMQGIEAGDIEDSYHKYIRRQLRRPKSIDTSVAFITYSGCSLQQLRDFSEEVKKKITFENIIYQKASASISCNCGPGTIGILFFRK